MRAQKQDRYSLRVTQLPEERACAYNSEPHPETPHETAENGGDFVSEELAGGVGMQIL